MFTTFSLEVLFEKLKQKNGAGKSKAGTLFPRTANNIRILVLTRGGHKLIFRVYIQKNVDRALDRHLRKR